MTLTPGASGECAQTGDGQDSLGTVSATSPGTPLANGATAADGTPVHVECSVSGTSTFAVSGLAENVAATLSITIPSITVDATESNPAMGTVTFQSALHTSDDAYSGSCSFYFKGDGQTVASGKIWGAFSCAAVLDEGGQGDTCAIAESYFVFENCAP